MNPALERRLLTQIARTNETYRLIEPGDRILVALSGGKDSYGLAWLLERMRRKASFDFELVCVNLDQGQPGFDPGVIVRWCESEGLRHHMVYRDTYSVVVEKVPAGKTYCSLCSRLRRGILYDTAVELGCTKLALGHHKDDAIETLLLNQLYSGQISSMPPILRSDDGRNTVIRPLIACSERDLADLATQLAFPILPCNLCGSQDGLKRAAVKKLIADLAAVNPGIRDNLFASLHHVRPSHLMDLDVRRAFGCDERPPAGVDPFLGPTS